MGHKTAACEKMSKMGFLLSLNRETLKKYVTKQLLEPNKNLA